jgi:nicotinate dehydrogenase subunit B
MDELSVAAGMDPIEFRLQHIRDERGIAVLKAAVQRAGWKQGPLYAEAASKSGPLVTGRAPHTSIISRTIPMWPQ